ncbi:ubiquitin-like protein ATG12 isoform X1 [Polyodon spathula]|uniref:ubiquitin-like protein ATG12 isoform X1 n=1 Tax=Polyodon spathula TaxID=7913 RepID=UPI001B7DEBF9|nr:ubiquitin-like protein ATG12 isoform X1 [Polyodon spathula]
MRPTWTTNQSSAQATPFGQYRLHHRALHGFGLLTQDVGERRVVRRAQRGDGGGGGDGRDRGRKEEKILSPLVDILLKAVGDAPIMKTKKWSVERSRTVQALGLFIKKFLKLEPAEQLFIYVNQSFAPSPDQEVGTLFECFGSDGKLVLHYCKSQAWG